MNATSHTQLGLKLAGYGLRRSSWNLAWLDLPGIIRFYLCFHSGKLRLTSTPDFIWYDRDYPTLTPA